MDKKYLPLFFLFLFQMLTFLSASSIEVNNTEIDSLTRLLNQKTGIDKIAFELDIALDIINSDKEQALIFTNSALSASKTLANKNLEIRSYYTLGRIYTDMGKNSLAVANFDTALYIAEETADIEYKADILFRRGVVEHRLGEDIQALKSFNASVISGLLSENFRIMGASYSMMGTIWRMNGKYDQAIEYIIKSKLNYEKAGFTEGHGWATYLLGRIYFDLKLFVTALDYFQEALKIYRGLAFVDGNRNGIAICYEQIGMIYLEEGNFEEARKNIDSTLNIYSTSESKYGISNVYKHLGRIEYSEGNYIQAEIHLNEALQLKIEFGDKLSLPTIYEYLGLCLIERGKINEGFASIRQGLDLATSNDQKKIQLDIYSKLAEVYLKLNDLENAIACQNKQIEIQNIILSGAASVKTEQLQEMYSQNAELEKQNEINILSIGQHRIIRNIMIFGLVLAFVISLTIYWFYKKLQHKNHELFLSNAAKDKFFTIIAHDLRGPTVTFSSLLEYLNSSFDEFSNDELKDILLTLDKSAKNISSLLENLLFWAQSQIGKIEYKPKELDLTSILENAFKGLNQTAEKKQIDINIEENKPILVFADPNMIQTVLRNILSNAIKFTNRGGKITVMFALEDKSTAVIKIKDNGVGIEKSKLSTIFEISNKHHTKGTESELSTGLGLIIVKEFVEKNKGTLTIESEKDKGTTVSFTLPIV